MDQTNDPETSNHSSLGGDMGFRSSANMCLRFLKRHFYLLIIGAVGVLYIAGALILWNAIEQIQEDRVVACQNSELRANALHNILVGVLSRSPDPTSSGYIFFQEELEKLPLVHCVNGKLLPVGEDNGSGT